MTPAQPPEPFDPPAHAPQPDAEEPNAQEPDPTETHPRPVASILRMAPLTWLLLFLLFLLILPYLVERVQFSITRADQRAKAEVALELLKEMPDSSSRFAWVAKRVEPCVVGIETTQAVDAQSRDEWDHIFPPSGEGSGVVVDEAGYIVTNYHVVEGADRLAVSLSDGRTIHEVQIVGADPLADIAVLKIDTPGLTAVDWGDSTSLEVGDEVLAVGNPFRLDRTVTAGIISAKGRPGVVGNLSHQEFLQTDAAVNPGNSGGPLVNMMGEMVGINTAIYGPTYRGISFAIPSGYVQEIYQQLRTSGTVKPRGWLGVTMVEVGDQQAARLGLDHVHGVQVLAVLANSPADKAGIEPGDILLTWNNREIDAPSDLSLAVVRTPIGSTTIVRLLRMGQEFEVSVVVGKRPLEPRR